MSEPRIYGSKCFAVKIGENIEHVFVDTIEVTPGGALVAYGRLRNEDDLDCERMRGFRIREAVYGWAVGKWDTFCVASAITGDSDALDSHLKST